MNAIAVVIVGLIGWLAITVPVGVVLARVLHDADHDIADFHLSGGAGHQR